ncbi:FAD-dependent oxidoreductase [Sphingomonas oleivorans]|uniref:FAD-dependent oxidoreductase n=1 Tax=Sphingomonas oleivorans TaxID=1735121 RepID=A0A2T5G0M1_9SPHN|nr:FAD-binding oxidoreductase [Sphingomonas oleivorans]PTQ12699.1 FAD-dependent oxidoreductase [Sphingomonas oleivorans]
MKLDSYWLDSAPRFTGGSSAPVEGKAGVVVIGGGFTGLSAALALARRGADVVLLEAGRVAGEASGRNGGHCNNGLASDLGGLAGRIGMEAARGLYRAFDDAVDTVERLIVEERIDCDFVRNGKLKLAAKPGHYEKLARSAEVLAREVEPDIRLLDRAALAGEVGSDAFHGGLVFPHSASFHMGRFAVGLAEAAVRAGVVIQEGAAVTGLRRLNGSRYRIRTTRGTIEADQLLLATGASMRGPFGWFRRRIVPIGSFIIATEPLSPDLIARLMPGRRNCTTTKNIGNYFRLTGDDRLIFGGRARFALSSPTSDQRSGAILEQALGTIFPDLAAAPISHCWGGVVDMTADRMPRAGERDGLFYSLGYSGHGTQMSVHMGQQMARVMAGDVGANLWRDFDWPAIPGHFGPPWFLPFVGAYYRFQDAIR